MSIYGSMFCRALGDSPAGVVWRSLSCLVAAPPSATVCGAREKSGVHRRWGVGLATPLSTSMFGTCWHRAPSSQVLPTFHGLRLYS